MLVKERLHPGKIFLVDTAQGRIIDDEEIKRELAASSRIGEWLDEHLVDLEDLPARALPAPDHETVLQRQQAFGYTQEDLRILLAPMAQNGEEPIGSMGTDTALAVLSDKPRLLYDYFKQLFAQVTNPPLDAIREELVTSMGVDDRPEGNLLEPSRSVPADQAEIVPIIHNEQRREAAPLPTSSPFRVDDAADAVRPARRAGLERAMDDLCRAPATRSKPATAS